MARKKNSKGLKIVVAVALVAAVALAVFACDFYFTWLKRNSVGGAQAVNIYRSTDYAGFLDSLAASGAVTNIKSFKRAANRAGLSETFKPGHYELQGGLDNKQIERV